MNEYLEFPPNINKISEMYEVHSDGEQSEILGPSLIVLKETRRYIIYQDAMTFYPLACVESDDEADFEIWGTSGVVFASFVRDPLEDDILEFSNLTEAKKAILEVVSMSN